jgi:hypothetical protein
MRLWGSSISSPPRMKTNISSLMALFCTMLKHKMDFFFCFRFTKVFATPSFSIGSFLWQTRIVWLTVTSPTQKSTNNKRRKLPITTTLFIGHLTHPITTSIILFQNHPIWRLKPPITKFIIRRLKPLITTYILRRLKPLIMTSSLFRRFFRLREPSF